MWLKMSGSSKTVALSWWNLPRQPARPLGTCMTGAPSINPLPLQPRSGRTMIGWVDEAWSKPHKAAGRQSLKRMPSAQASGPSLAWAQRYGMDWALLQGWARSRDSASRLERAQGPRVGQDPPLGSPSRSGAGWRHRLDWEPSRASVRLYGLEWERSQEQGRLPASAHYAGPRWAPVRAFRQGLGRLATLVPPQAAGLGRVRRRPSASPYWPLKACRSASLSAHVSAVSRRAALASQRAVRSCLGSVTAPWRQGPRSRTPAGQA